MKFVFSSLVARVSMVKSGDAMWCVIIIFVTSSNYRSCVFRFSRYIFSNMRPIFSFYLLWPVQLFPVILFFFPLLSIIASNVRILETCRICCLRDLCSPVVIFVFIVVWDSYKPIFSLQQSHAMCVVACIHYYIIRGALSLSPNLQFFFIPFVCCDGQIYFLVEWISNWMLFVFVLFNQWIFHKCKVDDDEDHKYYKIQYESKRKCE